MGGSSTSKTTSTTTPWTKLTEPTIKSLFSGVNDSLKTGPKVFDQSLYAGLGDTTNSALQGMLAGANNPAFSGGIQGALDSYGNRASGAEIGMNDPGYQTIRNRLMNDVTTNNLSAFNNSGMFGSDSNQRSLSEGLGNALGNLDFTQYQTSLDRQAEAAGMLPGLYQASQMPGQIQLQVGQMQDADSQAGLLAENDLFRRQNDAQSDFLAKHFGMITGATGATNTTTQPSTPWWQSMLGLGLAAL